MLRMYAITLFVFWAGFAHACYVPTPLNDRAVLVEQYGRGAGSGVWLGKDLLLTANHVVKDLDRIWVRLPLNLFTRYEAKLVHGTSDPDLAILKLVNPPKEIPFLPLVDIQPDEQVLLISYAYGDMSRLSRVKGQFIQNVRVRAEDTTVVHQFKMDEWTVGGDSGGAVYNCEGALVGLEFGNQAPTGENERMFAVPAVSIRQALDTLVNERL